MAVATTKAKSTPTKSPRTAKAKPPVIAEVVPARQSQAEMQAAVHRRTETAIVDRYLNALANSGRTNGWHAPERLQAKLATIEAELETAKTIDRVRLMQSKMDVEQLIENSGTTTNLSDLEAEFVTVGGAWARRKGVSYSAFRKVGVPPAVLGRAGIPRH